MLPQAKGHRGAQGHVVAVLLEDDLSAEEAAVLLQSLAQGVHHLPYLCLLHIPGLGGQPPLAVKGGRQVLVIHHSAGVVSGKGSVDVVHVVGRPGHGHGIAVLVPQQAVEPVHVRHHRVQVPLELPLAVDVGLLPEDDVPVPVVGDLVPLVYNAVDEPGAVGRPALFVLAELRVVVEGRAAPGGGAGAPHTSG